MVVTTATMGMATTYCACMYVCLYMYIYVVCTNVRICACMYAYLYVWILTLLPPSQNARNKLTPLGRPLQVIPIPDTRLTQSAQITTALGPN